MESSCDALALAPDDEDYCIVFNKRTQHLLKWVEMVKLYLSGELPLIDSAMEESGWYLSFTMTFFLHANKKEVDLASLFKMAREISLL